MNYVLKIHQTDGSVINEHNYPGKAPTVEESRAVLKTYEGAQYATIEKRIIEVAEKEEETN